MLSRGEDLALLLGRLFVAALFLPSGFDKLVNFSKFAGSLAFEGVPAVENLGLEPWTTIPVKL